MIVLSGFLLPFCLIINWGFSVNFLTINLLEGTAFDFILLQNLRWVENHASKKSNMFFAWYLDEEPFLILADHHEIRKISTDGSNYTLLKQVWYSHDDFILFSICPRATGVSHNLNLWNAIHKYMHICIWDYYTFYFV